MKREIEIGNLSKLVVLACCVVCAIFWVAAVVNAQMFQAAIGTSALVIVVLPFLSMKRYDLFSPWSVVMLAVISGCTNPAIAVSFHWPDYDYVRRSSLLGQEPEYFFYPGFILLLGLAILTLGYFCVPAKSTQRRIGRKFEPRRLYITLFCVVAVSALCTLAFIAFTGGGSSEKISVKRTTIRTIHVQDDEGFSQYGYLRTMAAISLPAFLIMFGYWSGRLRELSILKILILAGIFLMYCVLPFYASNRAPLIWAFLAVMGMMYYTYQKNLIPKFTTFVVVTFCLIVLMSTLRNPDSEVTAELETLGKHLVFNRNGPELAKTAHIINGLPEKLDYQFGKTIAVWLIAPIPRELIPDKPLIHYGPIIGRVIYGNDVSGVPPGLIAEMYLNFHIPGVIFGCLFFGWFLRTTYEIVFSISGEIGIVIPIYLFALLPMPYKVLASSLGSGILCFVNAAIFIAVIYACTIKENSFGARASGNQSVSLSPPRIPAGQAV